MSVGNADAFAIMARCFSASTEGEWSQLTSPATWSGFVDALRRLLAFGVREGESARPHPFAPGVSLNEVLSEGETQEMFLPPSFQAKATFEARHFIGGLPCSAMPVESLYSSSPHGGTENAVAGEASLSAPAKKAFYGEPCAQYMADLLGRLGLDMPDGGKGYPDHLSVELDVLSLLVGEGCFDEAETFLVERFAWLTAYRKRLLALGSDAGFYLALVDLILGIRAVVLAETD